jgi:hypothetical protein
VRPLSLFGSSREKASLQNVEKHVRNRSPCHERTYIQFARLIGPSEAGAAGSLHAWLAVVHIAPAFVRVILFLGILATAPIGSSVPGIMLAAVAIQMIAGIREPIFPRFITERRLPTQYLIRLGERAIPILRCLERAVHPRWPLAFDMARRSVGVMVLLLTAALLLTPVPLSNIPPAILVVVISLAYIEEDGLLLCLAFLFALILIGIASVAVLGTIFGALLISDI